MVGVCGMELAGWVAKVTLRGRVYVYGVGKSSAGVVYDRAYGMRVSIATSCVCLSHLLPYTYASPPPHPSSASLICLPNTHKHTHTHCPLRTPIPRPPLSLSMTAFVQTDTINTFVRRIGSGGMEGSLRILAVLMVLLRRACHVGEGAPDIAFLTGCSLPGDASSGTVALNKFAAAGGYTAIERSLISFATDFGSSSSRRSNSSRNSTGDEGRNGDVGQSVGGVGQIRMLQMLRMLRLGLEIVEELAYVQIQVIN